MERDNTGSGYSKIVFDEINSSPYNPVDSAKAKINASGNAIADFSNAPNGNYYIQAKHRNALETWSSLAVAFVKGQTANYNFTSSQNQAYGNNMITKYGRWCFYSGDVNQNGSIEATDLSTIDNDVSNFVTGYVATDVTGNNVTDAADLAIADNNVFNFVNKITPP